MSLYLSNRKIFITKCLQNLHHSKEEKSEHMLAINEPCGHRNKHPSVCLGDAHHHESVLQSIFALWLGHCLPQKQHDTNDVPRQNIYAYLRQRFV